MFLIATMLPRDLELGPRGCDPWCGQSEFCGGAPVAPEPLTKSGGGWRVSFVSRAPGGVDRDRIPRLHITPQNIFPMKWMKKCVAWRGWARRAFFCPRWLNTRTRWVNYLVNTRTRSCTRKSLLRVESHPISLVQLKPHITLHAPERRCSTTHAYVLSHFPLVLFARRRKAEHAHPSWCRSLGIASLCGVNLVTTSACEASRQHSLFTVVLDIQIVPTPKAPQ
jgi:hypothetical protein